MFGRAKPLAGLTPRSGILLLARLMPPLFSPYRHAPGRASELWREAGGGQTRPLRVAAPDKLERVARKVAGDLQAGLGIEVDVLIYRSVEETWQVRRRLAEKVVPLEWDILIWEQTAQAADGVVLELHRAFVGGASGEYRAGRSSPSSRSYTRIWWGRHRG